MWDLAQDLLFLAHSCIVCDYRLLHCRNYHPTQRSSKRSGNVIEIIIIIEMEEIMSESKQNNLRILLPTGVSVSFQNMLRRLAKLLDQLPCQDNFRYYAWNSGSAILGIIFSYYLKLGPKLDSTIMGLSSLPSRTARLLSVQLKYFLQILWPAIKMKLFPTALQKISIWSNVAFPFVVLDKLCFQRCWLPTLLLDGQLVVRHSFS